MVSLQIFAQHGEELQLGIAQLGRHSPFVDCLSAIWSSFLLLDITQVVQEYSLESFYMSVCVCVKTKMVSTNDEEDMGSRKHQREN